MGKKRRVRWIVGSLVAAVALLGVWAYLSFYNSTDARIDRAVAQIVEEYGFEFEFRSLILHGFVESPQGNATSGLYTRAPVGAETADEIVAILRSSCPSWEYEHTVFNEDFHAVSMKGGDHLAEVHEFRPEEQDGGRTVQISFSPDDKGFGGEKEPDATLVLFRLDRPSLWQRIKGLWPW